MGRKIRIRFLRIWHWASTKLKQSLTNTDGVKHIKTYIHIEKRELNKLWHLVSCFRCNLKLGKNVTGILGECVPERGCRVPGWRGGMQRVIWRILCEVKEQGDLKVSCVCMGSPASFHSPRTPIWRQAFTDLLNKSKKRNYLRCICSVKSVWGVASPIWFNYGKEAHDFGELFT